MFKSAKKIFITSITAAALFSGSTNLIAHADDINNDPSQTTTQQDQQSNQNQTPQQDSQNNQNPASQDNQNDNDGDDNQSVGIQLKKKKATSGYTSLVKEANKHMYTPYVYGANGPSAFDCSGFTRYVFKNSLGKSLPRTAQAQYNDNTRVSAANAKKGDLVFFGSSTRSITHVGIYLGNGRMIDAQNRGVIKESIHSSWWNLVGFARVN